MFVVTLTPEAKCAPGKGTFGLRARAGGDFFLVGVGGGEGGVPPSVVVVTPAGRVRQCVIGVVYSLEFLRACGALGGVGGNAVRVGFKGLPGGGVLSEKVGGEHGEGGGTSCRHRGSVAASLSKRPRELSNSRAMRLWTRLETLSDYNLEWRLPVEGVNNAQFMP